MTNCEVIEGCPFFNDRLANMPTVAGWLKIQYCEGKHTECARYQVRQELGAAKVPSDLFPNETIRAERLIAISRGAETKFP